MTLPFLPVGVQDFERIRTDDFVYVDKTRFIHKMVRPGQGFYFLSRPRRFGKSLTVSTLSALFQGKKALFDGLWISKNGEWDWSEHPVLLFDFNGISHDTPQNLKKGLESSLTQAGKRHGIRLAEALLKERFRELVLALRRKSGMPVVILADEYDKPLIDHLGKGEAGLEIAKENRDILKYFFGVIKDGEVSSAVRFVFLAGVSKFSRVSIFSELNNLTDLTMNRHYAEFLGYTEAELGSCFSRHIERFAKESGKTTEEIRNGLRTRYDGYRFSETDARVYNPFSVLKSLDEMAFKNYWFETGTPTFLVNLLREKGWHIPKIEHFQATEAVFSAYELERLQPEALLFQTGYVTIADVEEGLYTFDYPNREVKTAFLEILFHAYAGEFPEGSRFRLLARHLRREDFQSFIDTTTGIYASIPYALETKRDEAYFHTVFYLMVSASGLDVRTEVLTCDGRIDMVVMFPDKIYIIEFKCNQGAEAAIRQIREKGYALPYQGEGRKIILVGIGFDTEKRNISDWAWEAA